MQKTDVNTALAIFFVVFAVVFIVGLAVIPPATQQEAQAANQNSDSRNKGQQSEISSDCKRQGKDKKVVDECTEATQGDFCYNRQLDGNTDERCFPTKAQCQQARAADSEAISPCLPG